MRFIIAFLVFAAGFLVTFRTPAEASHTWSCYRLNDYKVAFTNWGTGDYYNIYHETTISDSSSWHHLSAMQVFWFYDYWAELAGFNGYYGTTGWAGLATLTSTSGCSVYEGKSELNQTYLDGTSRDYKKYVSCQEVGHLFGLDHNRSDSSTCMNDVSQSSSVPNGHDVDLLAAIYGNIPATCTSCPRIRLQASSGYWWDALAAGGYSLRAISTGSGDQWDTFRLVDLGGGNVAIQADNGQYVCAEGGGGRELVANRSAIGPWETFALIDLGGGYVALQAHNGQYVAAEIGSNHNLNANRDAIGPWETFYLAYQ